MVRPGDALTLAQYLDWMQLDGTPVRVLSLPRLIEVKKKLTRPKDQLALLELEATWDEREKLQKS